MLIDWAPIFDRSKQLPSQSWVDIAYIALFGGRRSSGMQSTTTSATFALNTMLCKAMAWRRKETKSSRLYDPLLSSRKGWVGEQTPTGYVPVLVGDGEEEEAAERFLVHVDLFNDARFVALLEMAAEEFGYTQRGVIRMPCNARHFEKMVDVISKAR